MSRSGDPWSAAPAAELDWTGDGVPRSRQFGDIYYSRESGPAESRHVFLDGNAVVPRLRQPAAGRHPFTVIETGFGTGLNFLLTWQAWRELSTPPRLHYLAVERFPLRPRDLARAAASWPELAELSGRLLAQYPGLLPGRHRLLLEDGRVILDLWWEDVAAALQDLCQRCAGTVDAWYLDGFAPAVNEAMWQPPLFRAMAGLSRSGATFGTFTAAGRVRRGLQAAGFRVHRVSGFGRKRECLRGELLRPVPPPEPLVTPWDLPQPDATAPDATARDAAAPESALVIGAGLAGAHCAAALARRGLVVTVLERGRVAAGGSGNAQGILFTRLSHRRSLLADFSVQAFAFAARAYRELLAEGSLQAGVDGELCGYLQFIQGEPDAALAEALADVPELACMLDAAGAEDRLGAAVDRGGLWFPGAGWLSPPAVCRALLRRPGIRLQENCGSLRLVRTGDSWQAHDGAGAVAGADLAVIACGVDSARVAGLDWLPLQPIRGQTTDLPAAGPWQRLRAGLSHEGYLPPARKGYHCIGATFDPGDGCRTLRPSDHRRNLDSLAAAVPGWAELLAALDPQELGGRVGFRCASPDYLPLAGPVPELDAFLEVYAPLRRNARTLVRSRAPCLPGLWLSTAHGSRGLSYAPLCAELIASAACGELPPLGRELARALAPARFPARDLGRNRR